MPLPPMRAVFFFLDAVLYQGSLQELDRLGEDGFFVVVTVEQQIMNFCADRGTGMLQIVRKEVISGNVQGVGDHDQHFKAWRHTTIFNIAKINRSSMNDLSEILLGHLFISSISLNALARKSPILMGWAFAPFLGYGHISPIFETCQNALPNLSARNRIQRCKPHHSHPGIHHFYKPGHPLSVQGDKPYSRRRKFRMLLHGKDQSRRTMPSAFFTLKRENPVMSDQDQTENCDASRASCADAEIHSVFSL